MPSAARVGDKHFCTWLTGPGQPVAGPIVPPGCPTVLIEGMPAARLGDAATCSGPPDVIITGSSSVLISGVPAARVGDSTSNGGQIIEGARTVFIGG